MVVTFDLFKERKQTYISGGRDSVIKIVDVYFAAITKESFTFSNTIYEPRPLAISPTVLRDFICNEHCAGCCRDITLDWLPTEKTIYDSSWQVKRSIEVNNKSYEIFTDYNNEKIKDKWQTTRCHNLTETGLCGIHGSHPFSCDFELLRFRKYKDHWLLCHQYFGRGWNMKRISDGERGALCEMLPNSEKGRNETIRKLTRLKEWTDYFELETHIDDIIAWVKIIPLDHKEALWLPRDSSIEGYFSDDK